MMIRVHHPVPVVHLVLAVHLVLVLLVNLVVPVNPVVLAVNPVRLLVLTVHRVNHHLPVPPAVPHQVQARLVQVLVALAARPVRAVRVVNK